MSEKPDFEELFDLLNATSRLMQEHNRSQKILSTAQKRLKENVDISRFDYLTRVEGVYRRNDLHFDIGVAITWKHGDDETALLYGEELENADAVEALMNTWNVLAGYLKTDDDVREYLAAVDFDNRTIAGANQYLITKAKSA